MPEALMKQLPRMISLLVVIAAAWNAPSNQSQSLFVRLKGLADGRDKPGGGSDLKIVGKFAYVAAAGLQIYSLANPTAPVWLGSYQSPLYVNAIHVVGSYAYLAENGTMNGPGAFEIIDVSDPTNPFRVGGRDTHSSANDICVAGNLAYLAEGDRFGDPRLPGVLEVFNVADPANPARLAMVNTDGSATSVDVSGNYGFVADGVTDLQIFDLSDPSRPQRVGTFISDVSQNHCGFEPGGPAKLIQVVGNLAYSAGENGLHILEIREPSNPESIGDNFCFPIQSFQISGNRSFATIWSSTANTYILWVLDASDPANIVAVGTKPGWNAPAFQVVGDLIYAATVPFSVYELSDRPAITSISLNPNGLFVTWEFTLGFILQRTSSLIDPSWSTVITSEGATSIQLPKTDENEFFRLARP
jgi:hypothetical protein